MAKRAANGTGCVFQPTYTDKGMLKTSSTWWYKLPNGQKGRCENAKTEREAREYLLRMLGRLHNGVMPKAGERHLTYGMLRERVLANMEANNLRSLERLANGDLTTQGLTKLDEFFGWTKENPTGAKIADFKPERWDEDFIKARRAEGVSDGTIRNSAKLLQKMFKLAVSQNLVSSAPEITIPEAPQPKEHVLYEEQFKHLVDSKKDGVSKVFVPLTTFLFYQGTRINEALSIRWKQIDLDTATYRPNPNFSKTSDRQPKILHKNVVDALTEGPQGGDNDYVFANVRSEGKEPAKRFEGEFRNAMLRLKLGAPMWQCGQCRETSKAPAPESADSPAIECTNCKDVPMQYKYVGPSPHSLRASCVVFYIEAGLVDSEIMKITGHKSFEAYRGYARLSDDSLKKSMDAADETRRKRMAELKKINSRKKPVLVA